MDKVAAAKAWGLVMASIASIHEVIEPLREAVPQAHFRLYLRKIAQALGELFELISDIHKRYPEINPDSEQARQTARWKARERLRDSALQAWLDEKQKEDAKAPNRLKVTRDAAAGEWLKIDRTTAARLEGGLQAARLTVEALYRHLYDVVPAVKFRKYRARFQVALSELNGISQEICDKHPDVRSNLEARLRADNVRAWRRTTKSGSRNVWWGPRPL